MSARDDIKRISRRDYEPMPWRFIPVSIPVPSTFEGARDMIERLRAACSTPEIVLTVKQPYPPPETIVIGPELAGKTTAEAVAILSARHPDLSFTVETK